MEDFIVDLSIEEELLRQTIEPLLDSEGFELVRIRLKKAQNKLLLAIFVDKRQEKNGIVMENLVDISRLLSDVLDATVEEDSLFKGKYDLEISSPGLDRPLTKLSHFKDAVNEKIKVRLKNVENGVKSVVGFLVSADEDGLLIEPEHKRDEKLQIHYGDVAEANIIFDFAKLEKNKKKSLRK